MTNIDTEVGNFKLGEKVFYDVFPHGADIKGIVTKRGVRSIGKQAKEFLSCGMDTTCEWDEIQNVRIRK